MKTFDFGLYIVIYNLIIGLLIMIASEKLGVYAGRVAGPYREIAMRLTRTATLAFGSCVAVVSGGAYIFGYLLRL